MSTFAAPSIAVTGMAVRLPGARDLEHFTELVGTGRVAITPVPAEGGRVGARGLVDDADRFDHDLLGVPLAEAQRLDRQHRLFLELTLHAFEHAGVNASRQPDATAVYASCSPAAGSLGGGEEEPEGDLVSQYQRSLATQPDYLATRTAHVFDLKGEALTVQTGCSSSLVALVSACRALASGAVEVAVAGGVSIAPDQARGYVHEPGMITSPDGTCRPFDRRATPAPDRR